MKVNFIINYIFLCFIFLLYNKVQGYRKCFTNWAGINVYLNFTCGNHNPEVYQITIFECETGFTYNCYKQCKLTPNDKEVSSYHAERSIQVSPLLGFDVVFEIYHKCCNKPDVSEPPCQNPFNFKMSDDCMSCGPGPYCVYHVDLKDGKVYSKEGKLLYLAVPKNW
uniref:ZP domain-containing protein n=1 Tax=Parastrongyloides trichosuri TaxID=131310 RepID=A0A0N4Z1H1_PARTI